MNILGICASLKKDSSNLVLLKDLELRLSSEHTFSLYGDLGSIEIFNPDLVDDTPLYAAGFKRSLSDCDALVIACPEYGHSLPGVLKNAIDWVIGSGELYRKRVAITAAVRDKRRGLKGLGALHQTLSACDARIDFADNIDVGADGDEEIEALVASLSDG